jgi:hypothetical protein
METSDNGEIPTLEQRQMEVDANRCFNCGYAASNPSDISPLIIALNAKIKTTKRNVNAESSFAVPP